MSSKPNIFYRFLYAVITFVYLVYCKLKKLKLKFGRSLSLEDLVRLRDSRTFTKRNDHTALIVNYEDNQPLTDADLVKLIGWCLIYGIPYVTVYDHDGLLIEKREAVCQRVLNYLRENAEIVGKFDLSQGNYLTVRAELLLNSQIVRNNFKLQSNRISPPQANRRDRSS